MLPPDDDDLDDALEDLMGMAGSTPETPPTMIQQTRVDEHVNAASANGADDEPFDEPPTSIADDMHSQRVAPRPAAGGPAPQPIANPQTKPPTPPPRGSTIPPPSGAAGASGAGAGAKAAMPKPVVPRPSQPLPVQRPSQQMQAQQRPSQQMQAVQRPSQQMPAQARPLAPPAGAQPPPRPAGPPPTPPRPPAMPATPAKPPTPPGARVATPVAVAKVDAPAPASASDKPASAIDKPARVATPAAVAKVDAPASAIDKPARVATPVAVAKVDAPASAIDKPARVATPLAVAQVAAPDTPADAPPALAAGSTDALPASSARATSEPGAEPRAASETPAAGSEPPAARPPSEPPAVRRISEPMAAVAEPGSMRSRPLSQSTALLPPDAQFPKPDAVPRGSTAGRKKEPRPPIEIGENMQVDRFGLIREIARGGMGQVFLARDTKLGRKVAIKFLLQSDPILAQRFLIEARATARVSHENIVAIYEVGEYDSMPYMVLEYLEGKTLSEVLEGHPGEKQFSEIMLSILRALDRAHEHGIVHRDLKPSNIVVTDRGVVKVLDFGVARIFDPGGDAVEKLAAAAKTPVLETTREGQTYVTFSGGGTMVGTLPYMSPESWGADEVDHQSDLWACGIMFWRALTGVHPAGTMNPDKLKARLLDLDTPLPSIGARDPSLPAELVAIVDKCLRKRKSERYQHASEIIADLQAYLAPRTARFTEDQCPYRGLAAFGEGDAKFFFGRSNEIRTALSQLEQWPLLAVIGPSGVGKSSFVHAGLVPSVRTSGGTWQVRVLRPGRQPLQSLAATLDDAIETGQVQAAVIDKLHDAPGFYGELLRKSAHRKKHRVLIVVDQLEELFTLSDDDEARRLFLAALLAAADDPTSPVRVVLSMRADFLDRLAGHKHFLSELSRGLFFLSAPDHDNLKETLVRPAELAGYSFEDPWIVDDMMAAATTKGALALLQFAATRLWDSRDKQKKLLTVSAYNGMGGVGGAFARHADEVAAAVPPQNQALLRAIMTRLVTAEGTRAVIDHKELLGLAADHEEVERILDQLARARLIIVHTDPNQGSTVEIVHEVLITEWPTLTRWLEEGQALRGFMQELRQATKQWVARGKANDLVWRGATAQEAIATQKRHVLDLSTAEREFLDAAAKLLAKERRGKMRALAAVVIVLVVVLG
ncbi:MAG: protein kinase, partial [Deltaproteobacteria bacterium]|nr:protein kinase [Deltaproteobacteria bacterium]